MVPNESDQPPPSLKAHPAQFAATSWTAVTAAQDGDSAQGRDALAQLCQTYWSPLHAYVRRLGYSPDDAEDLTQQFFLVLLSKNYLGAADRRKGKFRTFLLTALSHFLANEWDRSRAQKRGEGKAHLSLEHEREATGDHIEPTTELSPLKLFEQRWAMTLYRQALDRLEQEQADAGKSELFGQVKSFLEDTTESGGYGPAAETLGISVGAMRVTVHRLRQRLAELIRDEVRRTLANPTAEEVEEEVHRLFDAFDRSA